jgi:hypothetical protein
MTAKQTLLLLNRIMTIRVPTGMKSPTSWDSHGRNSTETTVNHKNESTTKITTIVSHSPLPQRGIYGLVQSNAGTLFQRGWARALRLSLLLFVKITA